MTKPLVQIAFNPVIAKIVGGDEQARDVLAALMTYYVDGYEHTNSYQTGKWDGRNTLFRYGNDTFPAGFAEIAIQELRDKGYEVQRVCRPLPEPLGPERPEIDEFGYVPRYDYQPATVDRLIKHGRMIARIATGGGKSRIARMAHARIRRRTIFITTRQLLLHQMKRGFESSGYQVGVIGDGEWSPLSGDHCINVAMVQTLAQRLAEPDILDESPEALRQRRVRQRTLDFLAQVDFVIAEEAHEASSDSYFSVIRACKNAYYAMALTATPFMRSDSEANMRLMACFGRVGIDVTEKMLIDRGILARPIFKFVGKLPCPKRLYRTTAWQRAVELGVVENLQRNISGVAHAARCAEYGMTTMMLVQRKSHGKVLEELCEEAGLRVRFIFGESSEKVREKTLAALGRGEIDVLIGSTILDVGVDVPSVGTVVLMGGGKAEVQHRQRIGRGLREKKTGPNVCPILDFRDEHNKHLADHAKTRIQIVKSTPGFSENLLPELEDFDFEAMGFKKIRTIRLPWDMAA